MRKIILCGALGAEFGKEFILDVNSVGEAVRALTTQLKGFSRALRGGEYHVKVGRKFFDETECCLELHDNSTIRFIPLAAGSKDSGIFKVVLGVALLGIGFAVAGAFSAGGWVGMGATWGGITAKTFVMMGAGMFLSGLGNMLSPSPSVESSESADDRPSYMFNQAVNITEEGNCLPLCYGEFICGSLVVSSGIETIDVA